MIAQTYLTTDELSSKIKYDVRTIRERLKDSVLIEGVALLASVWWAEDSFCLGGHRTGHEDRLNSPAAWNGRNSDGQRSSSPWLR